MASSAPPPSSALSFQVVAPGRICFFGEHSDYLGFPVIARAVPLYCMLRVHVDVEEIVDQGSSERVKTGDDDKDNDSSGNSNVKTPLSIHLHVPEELGNHSKVYDLQNLPPSPPPPSSNQPVDFALAAIHEVLKDGWNLTQFSSQQPKSNTTQRYVVHCHSSSGELPLQAGCSSSTAFLVAWVLMLAQLAGKADELQQDPILLAKLAWKAEVEHFGHPGGNMDHVSIALGTTDKDDADNHCGALRIGPGQWQVERLPPLPHIYNNHPQDNGVWILADSGEPKDTLKHLKRCKHDRLQLLQEKLNGDWDCPESSAKPLSKAEDRLWRTTLVNRNSELEANIAWRQPPADDHDRAPGHCLALQMKKHHEALRDGLGLSTPRLEAMNEAALNAGAWGFKVVGSGGGGCGVAWTPTEKADAVSKAMKEAGAKATWVIDSQQPVPGAHIGTSS